MAARQLAPDFTKVKRYIGREYEKVNCWELAREFYLGEFHIELRQYYQGKTPNPRDTEQLIQSNKGEFVRVEDEPQFGDLMLIRLKGIECHLGIFIQKGNFLHSIAGAGSVLEKVEKYEHLIVAYYRHKGFA